MTTTEKTTLVDSPVVANEQHVLVRNTATGMEQGVAAIAGLFTCGPLGALASWGAIRGLQGKWTPWFVLGMPAAVAINIVNITALAMLGSMVESPDAYTPSDDYQEKIELVRPYSN